MSQGKGRNHNKHETKDFMPAAPNHVFQPYISYIDIKIIECCVGLTQLSKNASEKRIPPILKFWEPTFIQQENFLLGHTPGNQNLHPSPPGAKYHPHLWTSSLHTCGEQP